MTLNETKEILKWAATGMKWCEGETKRLVIERATKALECKSDIKKFSKLFSTDKEELIDVIGITWVLLNERPIEEFFLQKELEEED